MITLKAYNKDLLSEAPTSYLLTNYVSGLTAISLVSGGGLVINDYLLLGEFGQETTEIVQIDTINGNNLTLKMATKFAHSESTKVSYLPYNQVAFYHTATAVFASNETVQAYKAIQADSLYSTAEDAVNATGYGWFVFYNSTTLEISPNSNYIPYGDFASNTVKKIMDSFLGPISQSEADVISLEDVLLWISEGVSLAQNMLNESNREYMIEDAYTVTSVIGIAEYSLPTNYSEMKSVWGVSEKQRISKIDISNIDENNYLGIDNSFLAPSYFLRGKKFGLSPVPVSAGNQYIIRYLASAPIYTELTDTVDLPGNGHLLLVEYLLYKGAIPLKRYDGESHLSIFTEGIKALVINAYKTDSEKTSFGIEHSAMV